MIHLTTAQRLHLGLVVGIGLLLAAVIGFLLMPGAPVSSPIKGIPIPFGYTNNSSFRGALTELGITSDNRKIVDMSFEDKDSEPFGVNALTFVLTPELPETFSSGAPLSVALTAGKRLYGYRYKSKNASEEIAMLALKNNPDNSTKYEYSQIFPGTFFASDASLADQAFVDGFAAKGITFLPLEDVTLDANARYLIIAEDGEVPAVAGDTTITVRGLKWCGNRVITDVETCADPALFDDWVIFSAPKPRGPLIFPPLPPAHDDPVTSVVRSLTSYDGKLFNFMDDGAYENTQYDDNPWDYDGRMTWHTDWKHSYSKKTFDGRWWETSDPGFLHSGYEETTSKPLWGMSSFINDEDGKLYFIVWGKKVGKENDAVGHLRRYTEDGSWEHFMLPADASEPDVHELRLPVPLDRGSPSGVGFRGKIWIAGDNKYGPRLWSFDTANKEFTPSSLANTDLGKGSKLAVFDSRLWYVGTDTVHVSQNGLEWSHYSSVPWSGVEGEIFPFVHNGRFWLIRGTSVFLFDNGNVWKNVSSQAGLPHPLSAVVEYLGGLWLDAGGPGAPVSKCGDGKINGWDLCDGTELDGKTCADTGYDVGVLSCIPSGQANACTFDTSACDFAYTLKVQQTLPGGTVTPNSQDVPLLRFTVQASSPVRVYSIYTGIQSANPSALQDVSLWADKNGDGELEHIVDETEDNSGTRWTFGRPPISLPGGLIDLPAGGSKILEIRADIASDLGTQPFSLSYYDSISPLNSMFTASPLGGSTYLQGEAMNGQRCASKPCDYSINFTPTEWTFDAPYCGDGSVQPSIGEQCEDRNEEPYDACYNCRYFPSSNPDWDGVGVGAGGASAYVNFNGKLWAIRDVSGQGRLRTFTPGQEDENWKDEMTDLPPFNASDAVVHEGKIWVLSANRVNGVIPGTLRFSADGITWQNGVSLPAGFPASNPELMSFRSKLWVVGGDTDNTPSEVYSLDTGTGTEWQRETTTPGFPALGGAYVRFKHPSWTVYQNKLWMLDWVMMGSDGKTVAKLIHSTDGINWSYAQYIPDVVGGNLTTHNGAMYITGNKKLFKTTDGNHWSWLSLPGDMYRPVGFSLDGKLFLVAYNWVITAVLP